MTNSGNQLWNKAKIIIPGGNQLLSKREELFLPDLWPSYYKKAEGCELWDLDNNKFFDFASMGVGCCTLGYANNDVNSSVIECIQNGSMTSLNCFEEVELAERLIALHPWSQMARFARTGGEACSIAIRIARAATGRSKVAICGYHGWHDWYCSANIGRYPDLDDKLLIGIKTAGVPRELYGTSLTFNYNNIEELKEIVSVSGSDIAAIIMEPQRSITAKGEFLQEIRDITTKIGAVLIFDEVTSGFRMNLGGIHKRLCINPDIAIFGKALGNGFPIAAIIGKREVMYAAQKSFISSAFWSERIGYVAALKTIDVMEKINSPQLLMKWGNCISDIWSAAAKKNNIDICISGIAPIIHIEFLYEKKNEIQTLYAQSMLDRGYLLGASIYTTIAYTEDIIAGFEKHTNESFEIISEALEDGDITLKLRGKVKHDGFTRLAY